MENKKIYVVMKSIGQYEDSFETPVKAFTSREKALAYTDEKNTYYSDLQDKYMNIDFDVNDLLYSLFDKYLEDTNKEYFEEYKEAVNDDNIKFDWDDYYDKAEDFLEDKDLVEKYMVICNITDKEREVLAIDKEFSDKCWDGKPFYYVSSKELELED